MRISTVLAVAVVLCLLSYSKCIQSTPCYVLALEGGGDKGAYQAGAIKGLVDNLKLEDVNWDIITGVSAGSVNALALSLFPPGQEKEAAENLINAWKNIKGPRDIYQNWPWGPIEGLFFKTGLYDISPSRKFFEKIRNNRVQKRKFVIGATDYESGKYVTWNETNLLPHELVEAAISSSSVYGIFPLNKFKNYTYTDGGVKMIVDISSGVNRCIEMGYSEENIIVDVIYCSQNYDSPRSSDGVHALGVLFRVLEILYRDLALNNLDLVQKIFPNVEFRYVIAPSKILPDKGIPLNFSPKDIQTMIEYGIEDAKDVIEKGRGVNLKNLLIKYREEKINLLGKNKKEIIPENILENLIFLK